MIRRLKLCQRNKYGAKITALILLCMVVVIFNNSLDLSHTNFLTKGISLKYLFRPFVFLYEIQTTDERSCDTFIQKLNPNARVDTIHRNCTKPKYIFTMALNITDPSEICSQLPYIPGMKNPCFFNAKYEIRCMPYFYLIAPQKSATTDMYMALAQHPHVIPAKEKERHWFNRRRLGVYTTYKTMNLSQYMDNFSYKFKSKLVSKDCQQANRMITGDATASTLYGNTLWRHYTANLNLTEPSYLAANFMRQLVPDAKFIGALRDPTSRLFSDYTFMAHMGKRKGTAEEFHAKVKEGIAWFNNCMRDHNVPDRTCLYDQPFKHRVPHTYHPDVSWHPVVRLRIGLYSEYFKDWFKVYPRNQFYLTTLNEYAMNKTVVLKNIVKFLDLPTHKFKTSVKKNSQHKSYKMFNQTKMLLDAFYKPYNKELARLLNDKKFEFLN